MPAKSDREYRALVSFNAVSDAEAYLVEGYASTFEPYVLPAAGMDDIKPMIYVIMSVLLVCTLGYMYSSKKRRE